MSPKPGRARPNPFVGPRPLQTGQTLYGRSREVSELRNLIVAERIVVLYAPSGAGKTSLIRAGLIEAVEKAGLHVLPVISLSQPPAANGNSKTNRYIQSAICSLETDLPETEQRDLDAVDGLRFSDYLSRRPKLPDDRGTHLLIFDQFEEILTLDPTDIEAKTEFFTQVGEALRTGDRWALFALREDHLAGLDPYLPRIPTRLATSFRLTFLSPGAALTAIQGTAKEGGVDFTKEAAEQLVKDLSRVRVQQADGTTEERVGPEVEPVQLQVVCRRLWDLLPEDEDRIGLELVESYGNVSDALAAFYAQSVADVAEKTKVPERDIRAWFDEQLITKQGIRGQVLQESGQSAGLDDSAIQELIDAHLVRSEPRRGARWFELAHDRLIDPVRTNNDAWFQANLSPLQLQAKLWQQHGRATGYLLTGQALVQAEQWVSEHPETLTEFERAFLTACQNHRTLEEADRNKRELVALQRLAEEAQAREQAEEAARREAEQRVVEQAVAAGRLRRRFLVAAGLGVLAMLAAIGAFWGFQRADEQQSVAQAERAVAESAANTAVAERSRADEQAATAEAARARADEQAATAEAARGRADEQATIARIWSLAAQARQQHDYGQDERGALLARQAYLLSQEVGDRVDGEVAGALRAAVHSQVDGAPDADVDSQVDRALRDALAPNPFSRILSGHERDISSLAFSPDGQRLASGSADGTMRLWDLTNPAAPPAVLAGHNFYINAVAFSPDSKILASGGGIGRVRLWDPANPSAPPVLLPGKANAILALTFSSGGQTLAAGSSDGSILLWDLADRAAAPAVLAHDVDPVYSVTFNSNGQVLAAGAEDGTVRLWDLTNPAADPAVLSGHEDSVSSVAFSSDGTILASGSLDGTVLLWNRDDPDAEPRTLADHPGGATSLNFSPDGQTLAAGTGGGTVRLWDLANTAASPTTLVGHGGWAGAVAFSPNGQTLALGSADGTVRLWDLANLIADHTVLTGSADGAYSLTLSSDGRTLVTGSTDGSLRLWDVTDPTAEPVVLSDFASEDGWVTSVTFSRDGKSLASGGYFGTIRLWNRSDLSTAPIELPGGESAIWAVAFSFDGSTLASGSADGMVRLWDLTNPSGDPRGLAGHEAQVSSMAFSTDERTLASGSWDGTVRLWDLTETASRPRVLTSHLGVVNSIAFSPDGRILAAGGDDGIVRLWETSNLVAKPTLLTGQDPIWAVGFSHDGRTLAAGSGGGTVRLWDVADRGAEAAPEPIALTGHEEGVYGVAFSPDGQTLASGSNDGTIRLWITRTEKLTDMVCDTVWRNLTLDEWDQFVGEDVPYAPTCPDLPPGEWTQADVERDVQSAIATADASLNNAICWRGRLSDLAEVVLASCERAAELAPDNGDYQESLALARDAVGDKDAASAAFKRSVELAAATDDINLNNRICWYGSLEGFAKVVLPACNRAIELAPTTRYFHDSRGVAHAMNGDYEKAIVDFESYLEWADRLKDPTPAQRQQLQKRRNWIEQLKVGQNPFDAETLRQLETEQSTIDIYAVELVVAPSEKITPGASSMYASQNYGYTLTWTEPWAVTWRESTAAHDAIVLYNGVSAVHLAGRSSAGDAAQCLQDAAAQLRGEPAVTEVAVAAGVDGQPLRGGDRSRAFVAFDFTLTPVGGEAEKRMRRLECWTLVPGESVLLIQQDMPLDGHEEQMQALEDLLGGLELSPQSSSPVASPTPVEQAGTPTVAARDTVLESGTPVPLPTPRAAIWSQES